MATTFKAGDKVEFLDGGRWQKGELKEVATTADGKILRYKVLDNEGWDISQDYPGGVDAATALRLISTNGAGTNGTGTNGASANGNGVVAQTVPVSNPAPLQTAPVPTVSAAQPTAAPPAAADPSAVKAGDTVYFLDVNTGKWQPGKVDQVFPDAFVIDGGRLIKQNAAISEAEAKRRGVHAASTAADRAAYIDSLHAALRQEKSGNAIIDAIVAEHNRIRRNPKAYAAELRAKKSELIKSRTEGVGNPDPIDEATRAIDTAIQDLEALEPLAPLQFSATVSTTTRQNAERGGGHTSIEEMSQTWKNAGFGWGAPAESISSVRDRGTDEEKGKEIVQGLFVDWGSNNAGQYGHRKNIIDKRLVSVPQRQSTSYTHIAVGIAERGSVYIQYYADMAVAGSR